MAANISQTFLHDSEESSLDFRPHATHAIKRNDIDFDPRALNKPVDIPLQGKNKSGLVQKRWVKQVRERANLLQGLFTKRRSLIQKSTYLGVLRRAVLADSIDIYRDSEKILSRTIV